MSNTINKEEMLQAVLVRYAEAKDKPMDYTYGYMDAVAAIRDYLNETPA